jgi:K+-sensing histidine kinase KdpD
MVFNMVGSVKLQFRAEHGQTVAVSPGWSEKRFHRRCKEPSVALRYGMPVVAVAVATLITTSSLTRFGQTPPFWLAILVKGLFGGRGPALLAVLLSIPAGTVVFVHPAQLLAGVTVVALIIGWLSGLQREAAAARLGEQMSRSPVQMRGSANNESRAPAAFASIRFQ